MRHLDAKNCVIFCIVGLHTVKVGKERGLDRSSEVQHELLLFGLRKVKVNVKLSLLAIRLSPP
jgi:hypothetical protein